LHDHLIRWTQDATDSRWTSWTRGIVHGPQSRYYVAGPKPSGTVIGAAFRPGMAGAVLGIPMSALVDRHVPFDELWGYSAVELMDELANARDVPAALRLLEKALSARIHRPLLIHPAVAQALQPEYAQSAATRVDVVQSSTGYSSRHFIALFRSAVGLTPKHFYRIQRFSRVLTPLALRQAALADLAQDSGYADQAHLSREFRELAGVTPSSYQPLAANSLHHHVAGAAAR
jgi:AraC-like DNA-binding protein